MERETAARPLERDNVISMRRWTRKHPIKSCPKRYEEVAHIAQELMRYGAVEVRLERLDTMAANRILYFLSGVVFALGGMVQRSGRWQIIAILDTTADLDDQDPQNP
ncbi:cell division protein SepF [Candidatus Avoscillospira sp. LCP25S3_F1]|uniref:cell division protein SepF n=1 Tax=Candidatus Avoscillospira sp. LCP25S3_F1 TaxID=3438825 RepID=UPI003F90563E